MGGKAITAMSIVAFPKEKLDIMHLRAIMDGGLSKLVEAGAALVGGHSVEDEELKYGFAVTGTVHPDKVLTNNGVNPNETLILTKQIGSGVVNTLFEQFRFTAQCMVNRFECHNCIHYSTTVICSALSVVSPIADAIIPASVNSLSTSCF